MWYIKILSPLEVQEMGKEDLANSAVQSHSHMINGCDDYTSRNDPRGSSFNGIPSVGSLDYWCHTASGSTSNYVKLDCRFSMCLCLQDILCLTTQASCNYVIISVVCSLACSANSRLCMPDISSSYRIITIIIYLSFCSIQTTLTNDLSFHKKLLKNLTIFRVRVITRLMT